MTVISSHSSGAAADAPQKRPTSQKVGIGISVLVGAFLVFDAAGKLATCSRSRKAPRHSAFLQGRPLVMGIVLSICVLVYAIPRTAVLGALGITAYLGGRRHREHAHRGAAVQRHPVRGLLRRTDGGWAGPAPVPSLLRVAGLTPLGRAERRGKELNHFGALSSNAMKSGSRNSRM